MYQIRDETGSGHPGHPRHFLCGSNPDPEMIALLEYFDLMPHVLKVQSCYPSSYHLVM